MLRLLSLVALSCNLLPIFASTQEVLEYGVGSPRVITRDFSAFVRKTLNDRGVQGLSLGIIKPDGATELGAWGNSSENGHLVDADVSTPYITIILNCANRT